MFEKSFKFVVWSYTTEIQIFHIPKYIINAGIIINLTFTDA